MDLRTVTVSLARACPGSLNYYPSCSLSFPTMNLFDFSLSDVLGYRCSGRRVRRTATPHGTFLTALAKVTLLPRIVAVLDDAFVYVALPHLT